MKVGYTAAATEGAVTAGDFAIARGEIVLADVATEPTAKVVSLVFGDIDCDTDVDTTDASRIINALTGGSAVFTDKTSGESVTIGASYGVKYGDVDCDSDVDTTDASRIINALTGGTATFTDKTTSTSYTIGSKYDITIPVK